MSAPFVRDIQNAAQARRAVIVSGPNTSDLVQLPEGQFVYVPEAVTLAHAEEGRVTVALSGIGIVQDPAPGMTPVNLHIPPPDTPPGLALADLCTQLVTLEEPVLVRVDYADLLLPGGLAGSLATPDQQLLLETLARFTVDPALARHRIVVIARGDDLDQRLARYPGWVVVPVDLPDLELRRAFVERLQLRSAEDPSSVAPLADDVTVAELALISGGLTLDEILRLAMAAAERGQRFTAETVRARKVAHLRHRTGESLDLLPEDLTLDQIVGLPQIRLLIEERRKADTWPRALIFTGPPGTGKTTAALMLSLALRWPGVAIGNVRGPFVGETERNTREMLSLVEAMAPLVVFQDEVDLEMGDRDSNAGLDGGTSARLQKNLFSFLGDSNGGHQLIFTMATNRIGGLDPATRDRAEIIPVVHPSPSEQVALLVTACGRLGAPISHEVAVEGLAHARLGIVSARTIDRLAQRTLIVARNHQHADIELDDMLLAASQILERPNPIHEELWALEAITASTFTTGLPWVAAKELGLAVEVPTYIEPLLGRDGDLDYDRLSARIRELRRTRDSL